MSRSPNLALPYIQPAQAQKHVTHNLAIERLDALVHLSVTDLQAVAPPAAPYDGQVVGIGTGATGEFRGEDGKLAYRSNGGWLFVPPRNGFKAWVEAKDAFYVYQDDGWRMLLAISNDEVDGIGVNTAWDATNRLAVSSPATLLTHEGSGHQLKINKAAASETASLLFQTGFSGRAEMGLSGDDAFSVKVSENGTDWIPALSVHPATGDVVLGTARVARLAGEAVQAGPTDTTPGRLMRADWGYCPGNVVGTVSSLDGAPAGAVIETGSNADGSYTKWADGTQICRATLNLGSRTSFGTGSYENPFRSGVVSWAFPAVFASPPEISMAAQIDTVKGNVRACATSIMTRSESRVDNIQAHMLSGDPEVVDVMIMIAAFGSWA